MNNNGSNHIISKPAKNSITCVDLFCGCGGMSLGFQNAGFEILEAFDNWKPALDVYNSNFEHPGTIMDLGGEEAKKYISKLSPQMIIGGPPCQDFSSAGPNNFHSARASLAGNFVEIIELVKPLYFVLENVPRIRIRPIFKEIEGKLKKLGYGLTTKILDASLCGVPQIRKRLFMVGALHAKDNFLEKHLSQNLSKTRLTMREYFGSQLDTDFYFRVPTNYSRRGVFSVDEPSMTIRAIDRPIPKGYPKHPEDPVEIGPKVRALTVLERSYVQTFPKGFIFEGSKTNLNKMIGNAVPVKMAEFVATALSAYIVKN